MFPNVDFPAADYLVSMVGQRQQQRLKPLRPISRVTCLLDLTGVNLLDLQSWWPRSNNHERNPSHPQQSSCFRFFRHRRCASVSISAAQRRHDLSVYLSWFIYLFFYFFCCVLNGRWLYFIHHYKTPSWSFNLSLCPRSRSRSVPCLEIDIFIGRRTGLQVNYTLKCLVWMVSLAT